MTNNPYAKVKANAINTASPQELTLMLYDGAVKFCNQALLAIEKEDNEKANNYIIRVEAIIAELQSTLDLDYEVSDGLYLMYDYIQRKLVESNLAKSQADLNEALGFIRELRDTWKQAMKIVKGQKNSEQEMVNVTSKAL